MRTSIWKAAAAMVFLAGMAAATAFYWWAGDYDALLAEIGAVVISLAAVVGVIALILEEARRGDATAGQDHRAPGINGGQVNGTTVVNVVNFKTPSFKRIWPWLLGLATAWLGWTIGDTLDAWGITPLKIADLITAVLTVVGLLAAPAAVWLIRAAAKAPRTPRARRPARAVAARGPDAAVTPAHDEAIAAGGDQRQTQAAQNDTGIVWLGGGGWLRGLLNAGVIGATALLYIVGASFTQPSDFRVWVIIALVGILLLIGETFWLRDSAVKARNGGPGGAQPDDGGKKSEEAGAKGS